MIEAQASRPSRRGATSRWFSPQPNIAGTGVIASYTPRFWGIVLALGVFAGASGAALMLLLHEIEHLTYGNRGHTLLKIVRSSPGWRHIAALLGAALIVVVGLRLLGRLPTGGTEVSEAIWLRSGRMNLIPSLARGLLSIVTVGMGVSLGREAAPQLFGAAGASSLAAWAELPAWQRRLLVASGAGAGFAAVYNVPLGGTLLAMEVMLGTLALPLVLPALLCSATATAVAWTMLGTGPTYHVGTYALHASQVGFAIVLGPVVGLVGVGWTRLIGAANRARPRGRARWIAPFIAFGALGLLSLQYPQLLGNGRDIAQLAIVGHLSLGLLAVLFILKPLVTAGCVTSGSPGGLFTPTFAIGVLLAGVAAAIWSHIWPGGPGGGLALIGGGAFLAAAMQGPLAGTVLVLELTRNFDSLMVPTLIAVVEATILSRRLGAHSIYSARVAAGAAREATPPVSAAAVSLQMLDEAPAVSWEGPAGGKRSP